MIDILTLQTQQSKINSLSLQELRLVETQIKTALHKLSMKPRQCGKSRLQHTVAITQYNRWRLFLDNVERQIKTRV